jgi:hypothetical protein
MNNIRTLARAPGGNAADARPVLGSSGLRPARPLALLLAPYIQPGMLVARVSPAGLGAGRNAYMLFIDKPEAHNRLTCGNQKLLGFSS